MRKELPIIGVRVSNELPRGAEIRLNSREEVLAYAIGLIEEGEEFRQEIKEYKTPADMKAYNFMTAGINHTVSSLRTLYSMMPGEKEGSEGEEILRIEKEVVEMKERVIKQKEENEELREKVEKLRLRMLKGQ